MKKTASEIRLVYANHYLCAVISLTFIIYGIDKLKAKQQWSRVSEATLILLALAGGSIGAWLGMKIWHHKTLHNQFKYGIPAIIVLQAILVVYFMFFR